MLRDLYKVITLKKPIPVAVYIKNIYKVYIFIKIKNKKSRILFKRKNTLLNLVLINIYGPLFTLRNRYTYFLKIVDNYFKKNLNNPAKAPEKCFK